MHKHHKIPKHVGGTDDALNIELLIVEEHAEAHRLLYEQHGRWQDKLAWQGLAGLIGKEEIARELSRNANRERLIKNGYRLEGRKRRKWGIGTGTAKRKWYYDPQTNERKCFLNDEVVPENWLPGQGKRKTGNSFWYTDGEKNGQFAIGQAPMNWKRGRTIR